MPAFSDRNDLPYPIGSDDPDMQTQMAAFAAAIDARLFAIYADTSDRDAHDPTPVKGAACFVESFNLPMIYYGSYWGFFPGVPVAVIYRDTSQVIPNNTITAIGFNAEDFDLLGGHSTVSAINLYTPPVQGRYQIHGGCAFQPNATGYRAAGFRKNGSALQRGPQTVAASSGAVNRTAVFSTSYVTFNGTTDYIELVVTQTSGGDLSTSVDDDSAYPAIQVTYMGPS